MFLNLKEIPSGSNIGIVAHNMLSEKLAKVVVSYTGEFDEQKINQSIAQQMKGLASVVESSFRPLRVAGLGKMALGYVKANREVRMPSQDEIKAGYRVLSSNILRSNEDRSLWEIKKGKNATYLARHGNDDISELVSLCTANAHPTSCVTAAVNASVRPESYDFVTFVNKFGDLDYGFVTASNDQMSKVVAYSDKQAVVIDNQHIVEAREVQIDPLTAKAVKKRVMADTKDGSVADMESYYRELFSYDEAYMREFIDDIKEMSKEL